MNTPDPMSDIEIQKADAKQERIDKVSKPYTQFSKKFVILCLLNLLLIEVFAMLMIYKTGDLSPLTYLISGLAVDLLAVGVFYFKNSESEKKARIHAEMVRLRMVGAENSESFDTKLTDDVFKSIEELKSSANSLG